MALGMDNVKRICHGSPCFDSSLGYSIYLWDGGEGGIRTHERRFRPYAISSRACSATPAPLQIALGVLPCPSRSSTNRDYITASWNSTTRMYTVFRFKAPDLAAACRGPAACAWRSTLRRLHRREARRIATPNRSCRRCGPPPTRRIGLMLSCPD